MVGAAALHFPRGPWSVWSFPTAATDRPAPDSPDRRSNGSDVKVKVRGVALMGFWLGVFLVWLAFYLHTDHPGHPAYVPSVTAGLIFLGICGSLAAFMPHPSRRAEDFVPDEEELEAAASADAPVP
jgi:hypothetical protein